MSDCRHLIHGCCGERQDLETKCAELQDELFVAKLEAEELRHGISKLLCILHERTYHVETACPICAARRERTRAESAEAERDKYKKALKLAIETIKLTCGETEGGKIVLKAIAEYLGKPGEGGK